MAVKLGDKGGRGSHNDSSLIAPIQLTPASSVEENDAISIQVGTTFTITKVSAVSLFQKYNRTSYYLPNYSNCSLLQSFISGSSGQVSATKSPLPGQALKYPFQLLQLRYRSRYHDQRIPLNGTIGNCIFIKPRLGSIAPI